ncbi:hypothetical protein AX774_g6761 [Zancudomyces culisetae]|uniref:Uncharacterized protein n=1 Tax=Zancudomyces culisetae TaxID=1213189 RepID=A0A1R1PFU2_ZANCU|nr:hypothetical protein AX774_g6761 [Zancudomyces culisetae]|eukprot:OMH79816.1 hypothetical protein AX774_g6761 [Zancudomyces culisetae]
MSKKYKSNQERKALVSLFHTILLVPPENLESKREVEELKTEFKSILKKKINERKNIHEYYIRSVSVDKEENENKYNDENKAAKADERRAEASRREQEQELLESIIEESNELKLKLRNMMYENSKLKSEINSETSKYSLKWFIK